MLVSKDSKNNYRKYKTKKSTKKQTVGREFSALEKLSVISNKITKKKGWDFTAVAHQQRLKQQLGGISSKQSNKLWARTSKH